MMKERVTITGQRFTTVGQLRDACGGRVGRLVRCDLSEANFSSYDFSDFIFDRCSLTNTSIRKAAHARFWSCNLSGADFARADLAGVRTLNCRSEGLDLFAADLPMRCEFWSGIRTARPSDGYKLLFLVSLVDNPVTRSARALIPPEVLAVLEHEFGRVADPFDPQS